MSYEIEIDDVEFDTGYGVHSGTLVVEYEPTSESGPHILGATLFLIGNNGVELGEYTFSHDDAINEFRWLEEYLLNKLFL